MNSPSHKDNILRQDYTDVGFAVVNGVLNGEPTTLVVQMFGKPMASSMLTRVVKAEEKKAVPTKLPEETQQPVILAQKSYPKVNTIPPFSFNSNLVFLVFLIIAVSLDFYFAAKLHIVRIGSKNIAHFIFIGFVLIGLLFLTKGAIL